MASIGAIFTTRYHTEQLNPKPNSSASRVVNYRWLTAYQEDMWQPFKGDPSIRGCLTGLRNKPQQKYLGQLSAPIPAWIVSQCEQLSFNGEKCVLMLCAWKVAFLKSGHKLICAFLLVVIWKKMYSDCTPSCVRLLWKRMQEGVWSMDICKHCCLILIHINTFLASLIYNLVQ